MNFLPPNAAPFLGSSSDTPEPGKIAIYGVCYDGTTSFRPGTRSGPDGFRNVSDAGIETYSPTQDRDLEEVQFSDLGNLEIPTSAPEPVIQAAYQATKYLLDAKTLPILLGGEHSISPGPIRAAFEKYPNLAVLQFDAHADLREDWNGSRNSHACAMRRVLDFLPADSLLQVGIRSGTRAEFQEMRSAQRLIPADANSLSAALKRFLNRPLYLTFDLDLFDPSQVPGTGTPEPGGITWQTAEALLSTLQEAQIVAADLMELSPPLDPSQTSQVLAAKLLRELILLLDPLPR